MHSGKIFQNFKLDKRSTLIFAANCTEQELSSSKSYYLTPNLQSRNAASFVALLFSKTPIWGHFGVCSTSLYVRTIRFLTFCQSLPSVQERTHSTRGQTAVVYVVPMFRALIMIALIDRHGRVALRSEILCMPFFFISILFINI